MILPPTQQSFDQAIELLSTGYPIALPTETVYGLAADATNADAVAKVYAIKRRPYVNPLIIHVHNFVEAEKLGHFSSAAKTLAQAFWPGSLTLIVPLKIPSPINNLALNGGSFIGIRVPAHPTTLTLIEAFGRPLAMPSANRYGRVSPTAADHVADDLGDDVPLILDGGPARIGLESTIIACWNETNTEVMRLGGIEREQLANVVGQLIEENKSSEHNTTIPGQSSSHYAPSKPLRLNANNVFEGEAVLTFGSTLPQNLDKAIAVYHLAENADVTRATARLFAGLRKLDKSNAKAIAVMPIPKHGLGEAINDRLKRAANPDRHNVSLPIHDKDTDQN